MINFIETKRILTDAQSNLIAAIRNKLSEINAKYHFSSEGFVSDTDLDQDS
jgi:hypothetical protein